VIVYTLPRIKRNPNKKGTQMTDEAQHQGWIREAREAGEEAARDAASWIADGNSEEVDCERMLRGLQDGDPEFIDRLVYPNLSGEMADGPTPKSLFEEITGLDSHAEASYNIDAYSALSDALCSAWEAGVEETFLPACEAELARHFTRYKLTVLERECPVEDYKTEDGSGMPEDVEAVETDSAEAVGVTAFEKVLAEHGLAQWDGGSTAYDPDGASMALDGTMTERFGRVETV
jgi:hypothetical protein